MATIDWTISQVRKTALQMQADNVTLEAGQLGFESDTRKGKVGPGAYNSIDHDPSIDLAKADDAWETDERDGEGTGGASAWGDITGTLSDQTDLQAALDDKLDTADLAPTATFSTNTNTAQDPGQDTVRFNNGTIASVTEIGLSDVVGGVDKGTLNSLCSGIIQFRLVGTTETIEFRITSVVHTSWTRYTVTYLKGALPANGTVMAVRFIPVNVVTQTITNGETTTSPSEDAVFDALAGKADAYTTAETYVTGDTAYSPTDRLIIATIASGHPTYTLPASPVANTDITFVIDQSTATDLTLYGNGKNISGSPSIVMIAGQSLSIHYSANIGEWVTVSLATI